MNKKICVIANGYAEEIMAARIVEELRKELQKYNKDQDYQFLGGSLVSSGTWFYEKQTPTFFSGGMTPSGGFPTLSLKGFVEDFKAGAFITPFIFKKKMQQWAPYNLDAIVVVGDFLLMMLAVPAARKNKIPLIFIPTAKSDYIRPHFKIEKYFIKKFATIVFPRDDITTQDFVDYGINALSFGNLMQDILNQDAPMLSQKSPIIALLPGSRLESYGNLQLMLDLIPSISQPIHWALVQANSLNPKKIAEIFEQDGWTLYKIDEEIPYWKKGLHKVYCYPNTMFDSVAKSCILAISLAGTVSDQIAGLGIPIIGFKGTGPQTSVSRMVDYEQLLGESFIYIRDYPEGVVEKINFLIKNADERKKLGKVGIDRMGQPGGSKRIAEYVVENFLQ